MLKLALRTCQGDNVECQKMLPRFIAISTIVLCGPLSLLLLWLWIIFVGGMLFAAGDLKTLFNDAYDAAAVTHDASSTIFVVRQLIGVFGGLIGWASLTALIALCRRPWSKIPTPVKLGCLIGIVSALAIPAAIGIGFPPILLCASLTWLAKRRDAQVIDS